jgi:hypothetical protein
LKWTTKQAQQSILVENYSGSKLIQIWTTQDTPARKTDKDTPIIACFNINSPTLPLLSQVLSLLLRHSLPIQRQFSGEFLDIDLRDMNDSKLIKLIKKLRSKYEVYTPTKKSNPIVYKYMLEIRSTTPKTKATSCMFNS